MVMTHTHVFEDDWLVKALLYYQIIEEDLYQELATRFSGEKYFFDVLVKNNYLQVEDLVTFITEALQIPVVDLNKVKIDLEAVNKIPKEVCKKHQVFPFKQSDNEFHIACFNPYNLEAEKEIEFITSKYVKTYFALKEQVQQKIHEYFSPDELIDNIVGGEGKDLKIRVAGEDSVEEKGVVKLVNQIFADAIANDASDIHIEAGEKEVVVRLRIDGVMHTIMELPKSLHAQIVSRIKVISELNIAETRKPQDGKTKIFVDDVDIDLRVSILPTSYGEKVVIRVLDRRKAMVSFEQLGIRGYNLQQLQRVFSVRQGMILVTGPTGSGKSTTLYAAINKLRSSATNILTVEDPIEYVFEGINQVQVNEKAGITFASALRSFLRQDPDVILVGEIRDRETAEIAIQAALTGHLVLSTLHTNDTFATITRLADMGIDQTKVAESLQAIIAQRLVRRLCSNCKKEVDSKLLDPKLINLFKTLGSKDYKVFQASGCSACNYTGYKGRIGVYEILLISKELKDALYRKASLMELRKIARKSGFRNLFEDGLSLVADGITDYQELLRVIQPDISTIHRKISEPVLKVQPQKELELPDDDLLKLPDEEEEEKKLEKQETDTDQHLTKTKKTVKIDSELENNKKGKKNKVFDDPLKEIKKLAQELKKDSRQNIHPSVTKTSLGSQVKMSKSNAKFTHKKKELIDILVIDDYAVTRNLLKRMLERQGWQVREAEDGFKALERVEERIPDIILLDLMMPNMDGYEFLQHLRSNPQTENVPVLIITSLNGTENELKGFEFGADDFVTKPINMNLLVARIQRHLGRWQGKIAQKESQAIGA